MIYHTVPVKTVPLHFVSITTVTIFPTEESYGNNTMNMNYANPTFSTVNSSHGDSYLQAILQEEESSGH
jgi:hypothetical protein